MTFDWNESVNWACPKCGGSGVRHAPEGSLICGNCQGTGKAESDKELRERVEKILNEHGVFDLADEIISVVLGRR